MGARSFLHLLGQCGNEGVVLPLLRLADEVHRAGGQGVKYPQVQGGYQDHRQRLPGQQLLEEINAAHARHLHVQGHNVGLELFDLRQGVPGVETGPYHLNLRAFG